MGTTTELGIDISTGDSVTNLQQTTTELGGLIEKYTKLMATAEKADDVFRSVAKAVGLHTKTIAEAAQEANKAALAATGGAADEIKDSISKSLSSTISDHFKGLSNDLKASLSDIPKEIKNLTTQTNNMATLLNNQLGGIKIHIEDVKNAFIGVDGIIEKITKKLPAIKPSKTEVPKDDKSSSGKTTSFADWMKDAEAMDAAYLKREAARRAEEEAWDRTIASETLARKAAEAYGRELQKNIELRKKAASIQMPEARETNTGVSASEVPRRDIFNQAAGVVIRDEQDTLNAIDNIKNATVDLQESIVKLNKTSFVVNDQDLKEYDNALSKIKTETAELQLANKDMSGDASRAMAELQLSVVKAANSYSLLQKNIAHSRKELNAQRLESSIADIGGWAEGKNSSLKEVSDAMETVEDLMSKINVVGSKPVEMFKDLKSLQAFMLGLKEAEEEIQRIAKAAKGMDDALYNSLKQQAVDLAEQRKIVATIARGYDPTDISSGGGITNTSIIQTRQEKDLLKEIQEITERVITTREKLRNSKGKPKDTEEAKRELSGLAEEYEKLKESQRIFADIMSKGIGITGSAAVSNVKNAVSGLQHKMSSLQGTITGTERSFKNMWGAFNVGMGKFLLGYHTISTIGGIFGGVISGMYNFGKSFAETGSKLITFEKQIKDIFGGSQEFTNREMVRLKQLSDYYGVVTTDIAKYYATISKQLKEMGANDDFAKIFKENAIAAIRGAGLDSGATENVFRALQQLLSKNQPAMEEITQQLSEHLGTVSIYMSQYLGKVERDGKKVYAAFANIRDVVDLKDAVSKGKVAMNDFVAAVTYGLGKIGEQAKNSIGSYEGEVARLTNAWQEVQASMMKGTAGFYLSETLREVTDMVKDPEFQAALVDAVGHITRMVAAFTKLAVNTLPELLQGITEVLDMLPGIDAYKPTANANPALKEAYLQTTFNEQTLYDNYTQFKAGRKNDYNKEIGQLYSSGSLEAFKDGFAYFDDGVLKMAKDSEEALKHQKEMDTNNVDDLKTNVTDPMRQYIDSGKASWGEALSLLSQAVSLRAKELGDYSIMSKVASDYSANYGVSVTEWPAKPPEVVGPTTDALLSMDTGLAGAVNKPSEADKNKLESMDRAFRAEMERLDGAISAAQSGGNWAEKIQKVANQADVKNITDEKFNPEQEAQLAARRAQATSVMQTQLYSEAMQALENIDAEIESRIAGGNLKNELKTQYEDIIKWQVTTVNKLQKEFAGLSGVDLEKRYADIQKAVERASEQALTQGNTPMEIITKAEEKAAKGRIDAWESTYDELVKQTENFSQIQIQEQWNLMAIQDDISGLRTEKEKKRIAEAAEAVKKQFKNTGLIDEIANIQKLSLDEEALQKNKNLFGEMYDADKLEETGIALEKLAEQMKALEKAGKATGEAYKELARQQQEQIDIAKEAAIENASSMTDFVNKKMAHEYGLDDNAVTANKKRYEDMYNVIESGATEMGSTLQNTFSEVFTRTLDSWNNVWKSMKDTFMKTLASMLWEAKVKPLQISIVAALTGTSAALAGSGTAEGDSQTSKGIFSQLSDSVDKVTDAVNQFGKDTLGMTSDLTDALTGGAVGFGVAKVMFPESQLASIGGSIGGAAGQIIGTSLGGALGGGIGTAIGSVAGSVIGNLLKSTKKVTDYGIRISVDDEGIQFLDKYERVKKSGSLSLGGILAAVSTGGRSLAGSNLWNSGNKRDRYSDVDPQIYKEISSAISASFSTVSRQLLSLGLSPDLSGFSIDERVSLKGEDPEALLQAWLNKLSGKMVDTALSNNAIQASFAAVKKTGETSEEALTRLVTAMTSLEEGAAKANVSISALAGGLDSLDLASYASDFSDALGGSSGVSAFFDRIEKFIGYAGTEGIQNWETFTDKFEAAINNVNSYTDQTSTRTSVLLNQQANLETTKASIEAKLATFASGKGWRQWLSFDGDSLETTGKGGYTNVEDLAESTAARNTVLAPMIAYVEELGVINQSLAGITVKLERESTVDINPQITANSTTFWQDYTKALTADTGLTPELAAAWDAAAQVAESMATMREEAISAAEAQRELAAEQQEQNKTTQTAAQLMGISSEQLLSVATASQALNQSDLPLWFESVGNTVVYGLVPGLEDMAYVGETALETFNRLGGVLSSLSEAAGITGISLSQVSGGLTGIDLAGYSQSLVNAFGSISSVEEAFSRFNTYANNTTEQEIYGQAYWKQQAALRMQQTPDQFIGVDLVNFWEKYREAMALGLSDVALVSWDSVAQAMENAAEAFGDALDSAISGYIDAYDTQIANIEAMEEEKQLLVSAVDTARGNYQTALQKEIDLKQESIDAMQKSMDAMKEFIDSIEDIKNSLLTNAGFLSATEKAGVTLSIFEGIVDKAAKGDTEAQGQVSSAASSAIDAAQSGTYEQYINTFARVYGQLDNLQKTVTTTGTESELDALIASRDSLQAIYDKLSAEGEQELSLAAAQEAYNDAQYKLATSTLDLQIAEAQAEADRHKELVEWLRKQQDTTLDLTAAAVLYMNTINGTVGYTNELTNQMLKDLTERVTGVTQDAAKDINDQLATNADEEQEANLTKEADTKVTNISLKDIIDALPVQQVAVPKTEVVESKTDEQAAEAVSKILTETSKFVEKIKKTQDDVFKKVDEMLYFMLEDNRNFLKLFKGTATYQDEAGNSVTNTGLRVINPTGGSPS